MRRAEEQVSGEGSGTQASDSGDGGGTRGRQDMGDSGSIRGTDVTWGTVVGLGGQAQGMVVGLGWQRACPRGAVETSVAEEAAGDRGSCSLGSGNLGLCLGRQSSWDMGQGP